MANVATPTPLSHIQAIVPIWYQQKLSSDSQTLMASSYKLFDGQDDTNYSLPQNSAAGVILEHPVPIGPHDDNNKTNLWVWIHGYSGVITSTTGQFYIKKGVITSDSYDLIEGYNERYKSGHFTIDTTNDRINRTTGSTGVRDDCLVKFEGLAPTIITLACTNSTTDNNMLGVYFSKDLPLPMYDQDYEITYSWEGAGINQEGLDGFYDVASDNKWTKKVTYKWSERSETDYQLFEDFFEAFGDNLSQNFGMCIMHSDSTGGFTPRNCILDGNSVTIEKGGDNSTPFYNIQFSVWEIDSLNTNIGF